MKSVSKGNTRFTPALVGAALLALAGLATPPAAAETIRVGKAVPEAFSFVPVDIGVKTGIFKKHGLDVEIVSFAGSARQQQALVADSIDVGLGAGTDFLFLIKGAPVLSVAAMAGAPYLLNVVVRNDGTINSVADLKGKRIGVSTAGAVTFWLVNELARQQGWEPGTIIPTPMGATPPQIAAMKRKEIDGLVTDIATALELEKNGDGKLLVRFGEKIKDFHLHMIFATEKAVKQKPEMVKAFLAGWFETIAYMRSHKAETVAIAKQVMNKDEAITSRTYDELMAMFSNDGKFDAKALKTISRSYVELKLLDAEPDLTKYYTEAYLPKK